MSIIQIDNSNLYTGSLILINSEHPLLARTANERAAISSVMLEKKTAIVLLHLLEDVGAIDEIVPVSGIRDYNEQNILYTKSLENKGSRMTRNFVALPGHSEHQSGMAIDLALNSENIDYTTPDFPYEGICQKFRNKSAKYGFIERYPKGKEKITGLNHEPWHFRYVGYPHSEIMKENDLTLEEYIKYIKRFTPQSPLVKISENNQLAKIYYVKKARGDKTNIDILDGKVYQISGNNVDGFIVTLFDEVESQQKINKIEIAS